MDSVLACGTGLALPPYILAGESQALRASSHCPPPDVCAVDIGVTACGQEFIRQGGRVSWLTTWGGGGLVDGCPQS